MNTAKKSRIEYRFENFENALLLLREACALMTTQSLSALEQEGVIQRFEYTWELAWKLVKDYLEQEGVTLEKITPSTVLKTAVEAKIIHNGDGWMRALDARNKMSHQYNHDAFETIIKEINQDFLVLLNTLYDDVKSYINES